MIDKTSASKKGGDEPLMTIKRAAALLGFHRNTITSAITAGQLKPVWIGKRKYLKREEVQRLIN